MSSSQRSDTILTALLRSLRRPSIRTAIGAMALTGCLCNSSLYTTGEPGADGTAGSAGTDLNFSSLLFGANGEKAVPAQAGYTDIMSGTLFTPIITAERTESEVMPMLENGIGDGHGDTGLKEKPLPKQDYLNAILQKQIPAKN